jgi:hypothetical protein
MITLKERKTTNVTKKTNSDDISFTSVFEFITNKNARVKKLMNIHEAMAYAKYKNVFLTAVHGYKKSGHYLEPIQTFPIYINSSGRLLRSLSQAVLNN